MSYLSFFTRVCCLVWCVWRMSACGARGVRAVRYIRSERRPPLGRQNLTFNHARPQRKQATYEQGGASIFTIHLVACLRCLWWMTVRARVRLSADWRRSGPDTRHTHAAHTPSLAHGTTVRGGREEEGEGIRMTEGDIACSDGVMSSLMRVLTVRACGVDSLCASPTRAVSDPLPLIQP